MADHTASDRSRCDRLTTASSLHEARAHLRLTGESAAVVYRGDRPVGLITASTLFDQSARGRSDALLVAVMDYVAIPVAGYGDADEAVRAINRAR